MEYVIHRISLDVHSTQSQVALRVKKTETKRKIYISLREGSVPYEISPDCSAALSALKPDGNEIYNNCQIENNTIIYEFTEQTTAAAGTMDCEVTLRDSDNQIIVSPHFAIIVTPTAFYGDEIVSSSEANKLESLIARSTAAINEAEKVIEDNLNYMNGTFANAFEREVRGPLVRVDDVSPVVHPLVCKVRSKNLFNTADDYSGYDYTYVPETLTVLGRYVHKFITLKEGMTYTFSCKSVRTGADGGGVYISAYTEDRNSSRILSAAANISKLSPTVTITVPKGYPVVRITLYGYYDNAGSGTATYTELMLEEGDVATGYIPYVDVSGVSVVEYGKNLFTTAGRTVTDFGASTPATVRSIMPNRIYKGLAVNNSYDDAYILSSDTSNPAKITLKASNSGHYGLAFNFRVKPGDTYTLSAERPFESSRIAFVFYRQNGSHLSFVASDTKKEEESITTTVPADAYWMFVLLIATVADTDVTFKNVQLESGVAATGYEAYNAMYTHKVDVNGNVNGIGSIAPTMTIGTDNVGAVVECEYNRDSNKVYEELYGYLEQAGLIGLATRIAYVKILAAKWEGDESPYSQVVSIDSITPNSQVDLTPSAAQLAIFHNKDLAFVTENDNGVVTVYAIGQKPTSDYTIQATITEVRI